MSRRWHRPHWARSEYWEDRLSRQKAKDSSSSNSGNLNDGENLQTPGRTGAAETEAPGSGTRRRASSSDQHRPSLSLASFSEESRPSSPANVFALTGDSGSFIAANVEDVAGKARKMRSPLQSTPEIFGASIGSDSPTQGDFSIHATIGSRRSTGRYGEPGQLHVPALMYEGTTISDITCNTPYVVVPDAGQGLISGVLAAGEVLTQDTRDDQEEAGHDEILLKQPPQPEISLQPINSVIHDKLWKERRQSASGSYNWFIPQKRTKTIMRLEDVSALLRELGPGIGNDEQRLKIARQICGVHEERDGQMREAPKPASKYQAVLAALVLCRKHAHIVAFLKHRVDDLSLPLLRQYPGSTEDYSLVSHNNLDERLPIFDMWSPSEIDSFYRQQWELIPTQFRKEGKRIPHHELRADHILPYEQDPNECNNDETEEDMEDRRGHYGQVSIYNLHKDQQTLDRYTVDGENGRIAVKKLNSKDPKDFFNESDVLMRLSSARKHTPHLARLLATYQQPSGPNRSSMEFFLMFECAESNLERFWANSPRSLLDKYQLTQCQLTKWVAYQCVGLADALATLHRLPKIPEQAEKNPATHGLHGDLKPANILRYTNWQDPSDPLRPLYAPLGVLQITDFGLSSLHHTDTMEDIKIKIGASPYKPPETQLVTPISQSLDIWMLGCLFLDFVTWLLNGAEGQRRFEEKRMERRGLINHAHPCFFEVYEDLDKWTHVCVSKPVLDWAKKLCKSKRSSQFVCDFVHLILKHMLVIEDKLNLSDLKVARKASQVSSDEPVSSRVGANELVAKMAELISNDDSYYTQVREQPDWKRLAQLGCVIKIHKSMKEVTNDADHRRKRMKAAGEDGVIRLGPSRQATDKTDSSASTSYTFR